jgi:hypothetical protein
MQKTQVLLSLSFLFLSHLSFAQYASLTGIVKDTSDRRSMPNSAVLLLERSDSMLIRYTRTNNDGHFTLKNIPTGHYLLLVCHPRYADYIDELNVMDSSPVDLALIPMVLKSELLEAAVVNGNRGAIHIKGDTVEFRADSFSTQAGATVEDLLKKLPGIQVDKNGKITAQGETVQKVLVDGEEFFGDDPTLVTKNLRADMVDKVQVFDKKSDQAAFTGIDDEVSNKTLNLKLKDSKKNGYFGRANASAGTDGYYDAETMLNLFRKKQKLAAYGILSNTGKTGLNWQERDNYGQSIAGMVDVDETTGNLSLSQNFDLDNWDGRYSGQGLPTVKTGGLHYNNKWNDDRITFNGNYKFMQLAVNDSSTTNSENILPDTLYYTNQSQRSNNMILRHSADASYEIKFDSSSSLKIMADGGTDHKTINSAFNSESLARDSSLVNQNARTVSTTGDTRTINANLLWRKKLPKKGRTVSVNVRENYNDNNSSGYLFSDTRFYSGGSPTRDSVVDQFKKYQMENFLLDSKIAYSEPLSGVSFLVANYGISLSRAHSDRNSFDKASGNDKYENRDALYSNDYQFNTFATRGGLAYSLIKTKARINVGSDIGFSHFTQQDLQADTSIGRRFINWFPQATVAYSFSPQRRLQFRYNGSTIQPTLQQIQPVATNEDPLNITAGNPGLKPQFRNDLRLNFYDSKMLTDRSIWASVSYSFTQNAISNQVNVDTSRKRVSRSINVNGNYNLFGNIQYDFKWQSPDLHVGFFADISQSNDVSIVNNETNATLSDGYTVGNRLYKSKKDKYDLSLEYYATYTLSRSSINTGITTSYWTYGIDPGIDIFFPLKFQFHADANINLRPKTATFNTNNNVALLNASVSKKLLKNDVLVIMVSGNDLLDQNTGFTRTVNSNFVSQNTYKTIKRYGMLSIIWNFTKAGAAAPAKQ